MLVLQTPPKPFNMHTREVDDSDDFVGQVPQCVLSRPTHDTSDGVYEDDDFVEPMRLDYSYSQPSESEDYGGHDSSDTEDREVEDLIRRDQADLNYNYASTVQYPPQPEVEFGFPQTCYCGGRPKLETSRTVNDPGRRYYTCDNVNDGDCHVHKWWDDAVMEEMRARDTHTLQLSEKVDYLTFLNDYDPQLNKLKELQNETEQKLVRLEKVVSELAEKRTRLTNGFEYFVGGMVIILVLLGLVIIFKTPNNLSSQHSTISLHHTQQYHKMTDPYYKEMKHHKREYDWVSNCVYANYKIPTKCICGGAITVEADDRGRNYYVCKDFKNDGLHIRHDCLTALEEELDCLRSQYAEEVSLRRELQFELAQMREEIKELKQLIMLRQNDRRKIQAILLQFAYSHRTHRAAVDRLAKAGLKEEIREGLETDEFATLEALFEEAEEVEEGLKETPPSTPRKRRRRSSNPRSSKRARKAEEKGDPEDDWYGYDGEGASGFKDDEEGEYWDWMQMETDVDDDASDRTDDTLGSGQFRMDNYPGSSGTDSSTSDSD
ncbi:hypothetical protein IGI04_002730 [Brassica rapa subsp. trilocularis]|nr:hypothetical protein IGI04_002730 [Brassica rapa subsp. trilocularis]